MKRKTIDFSYGGADSDSSDIGTEPSPFGISPSPAQLISDSAAPTDAQKRSSRHSGGGLQGLSLYVHYTNSTHLSSTFNLDEMVDKELLGYQEDDEESSDTYGSSGDVDAQFVIHNKPITLSQPSTAESTRHQTPKLSLDTHSSQHSNITAELVNPMMSPSSPCAIIDHGLRDQLRQRVLSEDIITVATSFWTQSVHTLSLNQRLELAQLIVGNIDKQIFLPILRNEQSLCDVIIELIDMLGWTLRMIKVKAPTIDSTLHAMGESYAERGIGVSEFDELWVHFDHALSTQLQSEYSTKIQFALSEVVVFSVQKMTGHDLKIGMEDVNAISALLRKPDLESGVGQEYLFRYLHQQHCANVVLFMQLMHAYHEAHNHEQRLGISEDIFQCCVDPHSRFAVQISDTVRSKIKKREELYPIESVKIGSDHFEAMEQEVERYVMDNHWQPFMRSLRVLI